MINLISEISCPACGHSAEEKMPENVCQFFLECPSCGEVSKPKPNDYCVQCSYGTVAFPSMHNEN